MAVEPVGLAPYDFLPAFACLIGMTAEKLWCESVEGAELGG